MLDTLNNNQPTKEIDLIGIGNAIVDILVNVEDSFLRIHEFNRS